MNKKGFTLIEVITVVAIIGILTTVVVGNINRLTVTHPKLSVTAAEDRMANFVDTLYSELTNVGIICANTTVGSLNGRFECVATGFDGSQKKVIVKANCNNKDCYLN